MDLLEYQGKQLLADAGVPTPAGDHANTVDDAVAVADRIGYPVAIKAQVQVGGRGKAGGIKVAGNSEEAREHASGILGMDIKGHTVLRLWIEPAAEIAAEFYASFTGMVSAEGGVEIEEVAAANPDAIARVHIDPMLGFHPYHATNLVYRGGIPAEHRRGVSEVLTQMFAAFESLDAELLEVNPLIVTTSGDVVALDAKVTLDENAEFRQELERFREIFATDPQERAAKEKGLNYIKLQGQVGVIGNGAGLVMSTLDVVAQAGGKAANFLDVGGGASAEFIANSLEVVSSDPQVKSILVNIFGGITRGEEVANGIVAALDEVDIPQPIVVRLDGTNAAEGRQILGDNPKPNLHSATTMLEAAAEAVRLAQGA
ncbi:MAG: ADP-forming succinate--CoA ligase subunit beta [Actinobacteria bacterium ATB1]|nr:ADP-forming succinate--CoA ligase subunit beta [Actinobacteria bacterium ATB1]